MRKLIWGVWCVLKEHKSGRTQKNTKLYQFEETNGNIHLRGDEGKLKLRIWQGSLGAMVVQETFRRIN